MIAGRKGQVLLLALVLVLVVASFVLGRQFSRPAWQEVAKQAETVDAWATVEQRVVSDHVQVAGSVVAASTAPLGPSRLPDPAVVTVAPPKTGTTLRPGAFVGEISGKPYFLLAPPLALYRDLREGDRGADVRSLQASLTASGHEVPTTGTVGPRTMDAVAELFESAEYALPLEDIPDEARPATPAEPPSGDASATPTSTPPTPEPPRRRRVIPYAQLLSGKGGRVASTLSVGDVPATEQPLLRIETAPRRVRAVIPADLVERLPKGTTLSGSVQGATISGTVAEIGPFQPAEDGRKAGHPAVIDVDATALESVPDGQSVVLTTGNEQGDPVPAVPMTALRSDGECTYVLVRGDGATRAQVTVLRSADGWAAVEGVDVGAEVKVS
ncbi:hypothetical protein [uncultured Tessaracoccus sp.]|uniref:hypothetical protein n=1 Tax=uncultured Tessaracoccus sp. TaxID=905023 RepID=UPI0025D347FF|nr:hypothetical protein [uncultured Tessaracoccus sp.]